MTVVITDEAGFLSYRQHGWLPKTGAWVQHTAVPLGSWDGLSRWVREQVVQKEWYASWTAKRPHRTPGVIAMYATLHDSGQTQRLCAQSVLTPLDTLLAVVTWL